MFIFNLLNFNFFFKKHNKYDYLFYFLKKFNKTIKVKKNYWKNLENYKLITFNHKFKKLRLIVSKKDKILINLSSGMATKKLNIEEKKHKKSLKIFNIMIKSVLKGLRPSNFFLRCLIQFKGVNSYLNKYLETILKLNFNIKETYVMFTPNVSKNFKFKKIRSLKKNFRKNYLFFK